MYQPANRSSLGINPRLEEEEMVTIDIEKKFLSVEDECQENDFYAFGAFFTTNGDLEFRNNSNESIIVPHAEITEFVRALEKLVKTI